MDIKVGILAYQGDVREHSASIERCGAKPIAVKYEEQLHECDSLIIPGGESTTIGKLISRFGMEKPLKEFASSSKPVFGTCAGMILLAREIVGNNQLRLSLMDITIERNAYGRQVESFETELDIPVLGSEKMRGVFIRAPQIKSVGEDVEPLAYNEGKIVLCRQGKLLASTFHPELTTDLRVHKYFLGLIG